MEKQNSLPINQSALFKITTRAKLAEILFLSPRQLKFLARGKKYDLVEILDKNGKPRTLQVPWGHLRDAHDRVQYLLSQLKTPDYLHSGTKGRSAITNAKSHPLGAHGLRVDIQKFFPNCSRLMVAHFFRFEMKMNGDVAFLLSKLCTCNGFLPTGSPLSMSVAYWMHFRMFDRLKDLADARGYVFTLYVDDMNFSSATPIPHEFENLVRIELERMGLRESPKKTSRVSPKVARQITGVILPPSGAIRVRNKHRKAFVQGIAEVIANPEKCADRVRSMRGLLGWMRQIEPQIFPRLSRVLKILE
jgi:RNA-directed DNA polymerase